MKHFATLLATFSVAAFLFAMLIRFQGIVLAGMAVLLVVFPVGYLLVSALWPPKADKKCPECGQEGLIPLVPGEGQGTRCTACGHLDEAASTAYLDADQPPP